MALGDGIILGLINLFGGETVPLRPGESPAASLVNRTRGGGDVGYQGYDENDGGRRAGSIHPAIQRADLIRLLDEMDRSGLVSSILDMHADDACATDQDSGVAVTLSGPPRIRNEVQALFSRLKIEEKSPAIVRSLCKYGDVFRRTVYSRNEGITSLIPVQNADVEIVVDRDTQQLTGFKQRGRKFRDTRNEVSWPWDFINFKMLGKDEYDRYGVGVIEPGLRTYMQLTIAEDFALMYRVTRQPDRLVFNIDIGSASEGEGSEMVQEFRRSLRRSSIIDPVRAVLMKEWRQQTPLDDIFLGKRPNSATQITPLPGSTNVQDVTDLNYFTKKFLLECNTPPSLFGYQDTATTTEPVNRQKRITNQDVRYANHIRRIQKSHIAGLMRIAEIHLTLRQHAANNPEYFNWLDPNGASLLGIGMRVPNFLEELERMEILQLRNTIAAEMLQMLPASEGVLKPYEWTQHVLLNIIQVPEEQVQQLTQDIPLMDPTASPETSPKGSSGKSKKTNKAKRKEESAEFLRHAHLLSVAEPLNDADEIVQLNETIMRSSRLQEEIRRARLLFRGEHATPNS
jgi:hypothetical protein